jgi:U4/U6.U5 tri-snRNP-associated protein 2
MDNTVNREFNYNLIANIIHDGDSKGGNFRAQVKSKDKWYDVQDLYVNNILAQSVVVSESYIHIYENDN